MDGIIEKLSMIKSYRKTIEESEREVSNLLLEIELELYERDTSAHIYTQSFKKRTPEVQKFLDSIDKMFGKEN